ncbi:ADP-ribosyltransferase, partial [Streptomyces sp. NPDC000070]|uniref:ADP-ribosyltransferase n=1 Tax=Streptomyces sp. NPDC000070 TaxID=3154240 RepID=UPI0033339A92
RAAGAVTFNVLTTVFTGGAGAAAAGAGKAGAVAKALSAAGKAGRVIDPMTYIAKGAGAGLSKIGDITKGLRGVGNIDIPTLPDGSVHLPDGHQLAPNGHLVEPNGTINTTPAPHGTTPTAPHGTTPTVPNGTTPTLPAHWTTQGAHTPSYAGTGAGTHTVDNTAQAGHYGTPNTNPYSAPTPATTASHTPGGAFDATPAPSAYDHAPQQPVPYGHAPSVSPYGHAPSPGTYDHVPAPSAYDHAPPPSSYDSTPTATPHTGVHDIPGTGGHGYDAPGAGHADDAWHGAGHGDDAVGHADEAVHAGDHTDIGHGVADAAAHHGTDAPVTPGHQGTDVPGHGGAGEPFEYKPIMSADDFDDLATDAERHEVATSELQRGTNPYPSTSNKAGKEYGDAYWNDFLDNLDPKAKGALERYSSFYYKNINGQLRDVDVPLKPQVQSLVDDMDRVMGGRPVPEDIMVVRGTEYDHVLKEVDSVLDMEGRTFTDDGFTSTSLGKTAAFDHQPMIMHLRVPKGTPALWIDHISLNKGERELLLARGSQYKVTRVFQDTAGKWHVYGEVLPRRP